MEKITVIGLDLAKSVFQAHGANAAGARVFSRRLSRTQLAAFFAKQPPCIVAMEACGGAHHWGRLIAGFGHEVRMLPAAEVTPFVREPKTDASDAAAIAEAAVRPALRTVPLKTPEAQALCSAHALRDRLIAMRTMQINMLRSHLSEYGMVAATGREGQAELKELVRTGLAGQPATLAGALLALVEAMDAGEAAIAAVDYEIAAAAKPMEAVARLREVDGIGLLSASALVAFGGDLARFKSSRAFVSWLGLAPKVEKSANTVRIGSITKKGNEYLRRLLVHGARSLLHWSSLGKAGGRRPWLEDMLKRRPKPVVIVALAAKLARIAWVILVRGGRYRPPAAAVAPPREAAAA